jgi:tetratricopeptide (TPR) repeat protein
MERPNRQVWLICLVLAVVTFVLYAPVLNDEFINFDDPVYVTENSYVLHGVTPSALAWAFSSSKGGNWHPLTWVSHMIDCQIYGLKHPGGHHLTNLLFHITNAVLLFLVFWRMTGAVWRSALVAALFAWHPMHVESVAWVAERKDVLSAFFWMLAMLAYASYAETQRERNPKSRIYYGLTLLFFALGLMSKPMVVTLPFALLLLDYWPLRRMEGWPRRENNPPEPDHKLSLTRLIREKIPFFILIPISSLITFAAQKKGGAVVGLETFSYSSRMANIITAYVKYLGKLAWPSNLAVFYPFIREFSLWHVFGAALLLILLSVIALRLARSRPYLLVGWLWFLGILVPAIGLVQVGTQSMADRYSYLPYVGLFIVFAWALGDLLGRGKTSEFGLGWILIAPVLLACLVVTSRQLRYWKNSEVLFRHDLAVAPYQNYKGHINLGSALDAEGHSAEATKEIMLALKLDSSSPLVLNAVGEHFARMSDVTNAIKFYELALNRQPQFGDAHYNLGNVLAHNGQFADAAREYSAALEISPDSPDAHNNLGAVLLQMGRLDEGVAELKQALRLNPDFSEAEDQLASVFLRQGNLDQAKLHYQDALRLNPDFTHARVKLGVVLAQQGDLAQALDCFTTASAQEPTNFEARFNAAAAYFSLGQYDLAAKNFAETVRLKPDSPEARTRLALALAYDRKFAEAIAAYREAVRLKPDSLQAVQGLAWVLAASPDASLRNGPEAVRLAEQADAMTKHSEPMILSTLDIAYAEAGRFPEAIATAELAKKLALERHQKIVADKAEKRLELYRAGKPYHDEGKPKP